MTAYSMVFMDIDGTLVDSKFGISENTKRLLKRLEKKGIPIVLCSARNPAGVELVAEQAGIHAPIVCYGGSLILAADRSILEDRGIPLETAARFKRYTEERYPDIFVSTYLYGVWLVDDADDPLARRDAEILQCEPVAGNLAEAGVEHVHKLLCVGPPGRILALQAEQAFPELQLLRSGVEYLEVLAEGVSKGSALEQLCRRYGVSRETVVACGDHFVDIEMLRAAGLGIAMGNAPEQVKAAADRVTATNDEEGVYIALKNLRFMPPQVLD